MARTKIDVSLINPVSSPLQMGANKITGLANGTVATDAAAFGQVKIIQTVVATHTADVTSSSSTYIDTGLSASITPLVATSKIRIMVIHQFATSLFGGGGSIDAGIKVFRDAVLVKTWPDCIGLGNLNAATAGIRGNVCQCVDDVPGDTSAHVYKTQFASVGSVQSVTIYESTGGSGFMILQEIQP